MLWRIIGMVLVVNMWLVAGGESDAQKQALEVLRAMSERYASLVEYSSSGLVEVRAVGLESPSRKTFKMIYGENDQFKLSWTGEDRQVHTFHVKTPRLICGSSEREVTKTRRSSGDNLNVQLPPVTAASGEPGFGHLLVNDVCGLCIDALIDPCVIGIQDVDGTLCYQLEARYRSTSAVYRLWIGIEDFYLRKVTCDLGDRVGLVTQIFRYIRVKSTPGGEWLEVAEAIGATASADRRSQTP